MRQIARDLVKEARAALESAARSGQQPPMWVQELLTPAGKAHYQDLLLESETIPTQEALGVLAIYIRQRYPLLWPHRQRANQGVVGFYPAPPANIPLELPESLATHGLSVGQSCKKCGCPLTWFMEDHDVCVRCYPPRGYHTCSEQVDALYPRRRRW